MGSAAFWVGHSVHVFQRRKGSWALFGFAVLAPAVLSCDRVSVTSVAVATVNIVPASAELVTGQVLQLSALAQDGSGAPISTDGVQWSATPAEIAEVDASGRLVALAPGAATISASTGGVVGTASVAVGVPGLLALSANDVAFTALSGAAPPPAQMVSVDVSAGLATELSTQTSYGSGGAGWLVATLSGTRAPANLSLRSNADGLAVGTYTATVQVLSGSASNSPLQVNVSLTVEKTVIQLSADTLNFSGSQTRSVQITNGGAGALTGLSTSIEYTPGEPTGWLAAGLGSTVAPAALALITNDFSVPPGAYSARVIVSATSPGVEDAIITVTLQGGQFAPSLNVSPDTLRLTATKGAIATGVANITNSGSGLLQRITRTISYAPGQAAGWLSTTLSTSTAPAVLTATAVTAGLNVGSYAAAIEVAAQAPNSPVSLPVLLTVTPVVVLPPSAPSALTATVATTPASVTLDWTDNSSDETRFEVERAAGGGAWQALDSTAANVNTYVDAAVLAGGSYDYRVRACNAGGCSTWSSTTTATIPGTLTPPSEPGAPVLTVLSAIDIDMVWSHNDPTTETYELHRRGPGSTWSRIATLEHYTKTYRDTGLLPGTQYRYRVRACNTAGCSTFSPVRRATTQNPTTVPKSPTNPTILEASRQRVVIGWNDVSPDETPLHHRRGQPDLIMGSHRPGGGEHQQLHRYQRCHWPADLLPSAGLQSRRMFGGVYHECDRPLGRKPGLYPKRSITTTPIASNASMPTKTSGACSNVTRRVTSFWGSSAFDSTIRSMSSYRCACMP